MGLAPTGYRSTPPGPIILLIYRVGISALTDIAHIRLHIRDEKDAKVTRFEKFTIWERNPE